ncbi:hypothetical protein FA95DRAFT_1499707 [Auriscalpium vulgare]|uniref:Uncharacterized protein n=1 Tax=Auriscalpium vulgare TaxID=40419 RepID=A0ACB8RF60_9AGAM|nr:hypothetical protein FA95DRAFT_1499707 [Auriscalpium vulgare]
MFSSAVQPSIVSLFSSTGSDTLSLWSTHTDASLPSDSFICLLNDHTSLPAPPPPAALIVPHAIQPDAAEEAQKHGYKLGQTVLHIQSPSLPTTYVRCPSMEWSSWPGRAGDLGLKLPWLHLQVRNIGREWSFEVGLVDTAGKEGIVRCSTFQKSPALKPGSPPILHLPLSFPAASSTPLTSWSEIPLHLPALLPHFSSHTLLQQDDESGSDGAGPGPSVKHTAMPSAKFGHISYVKIFATCRLRRVWLSERATSGGQKMPWEFLLYAADV